MSKTIAGCLAAAVLLTSGCGAMQRANEAAQQAAFARQVKIVEQMSPEQRARLRRDLYAQDYCVNQAAMANMAQHGLVNAALAGIGMQATCIDFYQRTGHLPGQAF